MRRGIFTVVLMILSLAAVPAEATRVKVETGGRTMSPQIREQVYRLLHLSMEYVIERRFEAAENCLSQALKLNPDHLMTNAFMARLMVNRGMEDEARRYNARVEALYPGAPPAEQIWVRFEQIWKKGGKDQIQETHLKLKELLAQNDNDPVLYYVAGMFYSQLHKYTLTATYFEKALELAPYMAQAHNLLGYNYTYMYKYDLAVKHLEMYAKIFPDHPNPHDSLGEIYLMTGRYDEAIAQFQDALRLDPELEYVIEHMIDVLNAKGQYSRAMKFAQKMWELADSDEGRVQALLKMSECYHFKGEYDKALAKARAALELNPKGHEVSRANYAMGVALLQSGRMDELQKVLDNWQKVIAARQTSAPKNMNGSPQYRGEPFFDYLVGRMNVTLGNFSTAIELFRKVNDYIAIPHRAIFSRWALAEAYLAAGQIDLARDVIDQNLAINPNHVPSLLLKAKIAVATAQKDEARLLVARCLDVQRDGDKHAPLYQDVKHLSDVLN
jgi:tetratricopeptide (TPR) repeat protein